MNRTNPNAAATGPLRLMPLDTREQDDDMLSPVDVLDDRGVEQRRQTGGPGMPDVHAGVATGQFIGP